MKPPILEVRDLTIRRGDTVILDRVSWSVQRGEHWAILGANGSGKTSLLSALTGYLSPTDGEIVVLGQRFGESDWRELRKHIGIVSSSVRQMMADHEPALTSVISGKYAMIDYWGRVKSADRVTAERILRDVEASHLAKRTWQVLSQGERQRVLIGRALMARPRLILLDEPSMGLAPRLVEEIFEIVARLNREAGVALLVAEQNAGLALRHANYGYILENGRVVLDGVAENLKNNEDVKEFYLGLNSSGRRSFRDTKSYKRRKRWL